MHMHTTISTGSFGLSGSLSKGFKYIFKSWMPVLALSEQYFLIKLAPNQSEGIAFSGSMNAALCDFWYAAP